MKKTLFTIGLLLILGAVLFGTNIGATKWLANTYLKRHNVEITCLNYRLTLPDIISLDEICLISGDITVNAMDSSFSFADSGLTIDKLTVSLSSSTSDNKEPFVIPELPDTLPKINVRKGIIRLPFLMSPLEFSISHLSPNQIRIENDWRLGIQTNSGKLTGELDWRLADLAEVYSTPGLQTLSVASLHFPMLTKFSISDQKITVAHAMQLQYSYANSTCDLTIDAKGDLFADVNVHMQLADIDLSQFHVSGSIGQCNYLSNLPEHYQFTDFNLDISDPVTVSKEGIFIPYAQVNISDEITLALDAKNSKVVSMDNVKSDITLTASVEDWAFLDAQAQITLTSGLLSIDEGSSSLRITKFTHQDIFTEGLSLKSEFQLSHQAELTSKHDVNVRKLGQNDLLLKGFQSDITLNGNSLNELNVKMKNTLRESLIGTSKLQQIENEIDINILQLKEFTGQGATTIEQAQVNAIELGNLQSKHQFSYNITTGDSTSQSSLSLPSGMIVDYGNQNTVAHINLPEQPATHGNLYISQIEPNLRLNDGNMSLSFQYDIENNLAKGHLLLSQLSAKFQDYRLNKLDFHPEFTVNSAGLQLDNGKLEIHQMFTGTEITNILANIDIQDNVAVARNIQGELLGGRFLIENVNLTNTDQMLDLNLEEINLAKLLQLQEDAGVQGPGIDISGNIGGSFPLKIENGQASILGAQLQNLGPGWLKIQGNAAFEALKQQQPEISSQLAILENLQYESLQSHVKMQADGLVNLDMSIKGRNPEVNEEIHFNYTHEQNLFTLLQSLRLADEVKEKVEKALSDNDMAK